MRWLYQQGDSDRLAYLAEYEWLLERRQSACALLREISDVDQLRSIVHGVGPPSKPDGIVAAWNDAQASNERLRELLGLTADPLEAADRPKETVVPPKDSDRANESTDRPREPGGWLAGSGYLAAWDCVYCLEEALICFVPADLLASWVS